MNKPEKEDASQRTVRTARESTAKLETPLPGDLEAAWAEWSKGIQNVDNRARILLRAAFEAGWEAAKH
jgi:hypothetical protein